MHLARVIGTVVATTKDENLSGERLLIVQPLDYRGRETREPLIAVDTVSSAPGQLVFFVESREAALALRRTFNPSDAAIMGIVDEVRAGNSGIS
jgi:ethanolamine utilization protein EutN